MSNDNNPFDPYQPINQAEADRQRLINELTAMQRHDMLQQAQLGSLTGLAMAARNQSMAQQMQAQQSQQNMQFQAMMNAAGQSQFMPKKDFKINGQPVIDDLDI